MRYLRYPLLDARINPNRRVIIAISEATGIPISKSPQNQRQFWRWLKAYPWLPSDLLMQEYRAMAKSGHRPKSEAHEWVPLLISYQKWDLAINKLNAKAETKYLTLGLYALLLIGYSYRLHVPVLSQQDVYTLLGRDYKQGAEALFHTVASEWPEAFSVLDGYLAVHDRAYQPFRSFGFKSRMKRGGVKKNARKHTK